jgi:hypothetical protein
MPDQPQQLSFTGAPVDMAEAGKPPRLTNNQRLAIELIAKHGHVTLPMLSFLIHDGQYCATRVTAPLDQRTETCCDEGRDLAYRTMKQLTKRGVTQRSGRGSWRLVEKD